MEKRPPRPMTPFDELVIPQQLHMLKLMLPYTPSSNQQFLGVFIKFLELKETIAFFQDSGNDLHTQAFSGNPSPTPMDMLGELKPYMSPKEADMMDTFLNMMNILEMVQMFQENGGTPEQPFADMMGAFASAGGSADFGSGNVANDSSDTGFGRSSGGNPHNDTHESRGGHSGGFNPMDMMMGMLTPEQQNMFQMYNDMFSQEMKGDSDNGRMDEPPGDEEYRPGQARTDSDGSVTDEW